MLLFHTPTTDIVLRMVGLSLLQPMYLQKMQTCGGGGGGGGGGQRNSGERAAMVKLDRDICRTEYFTIPYSNHSQNIEGGWLVSSSTGVPTENAKSFTPLLSGLASDSEKEGLVKLDRRKTEYVTIPYSNHSQNIEECWLVSSSTSVPTDNAKSLTPHIRGWGVGGSEIEAK